MANYSPMNTAYDVVTVGSLFVELTPETAGEALVAARHYTLVAGGAAANVVFALARLGVRVGFITAVGDDEFGTLATTELASFGVETTGVRRVAGQLTPVTFCAVDLQGGKQFRFYRFPQVCQPMSALVGEDFALVEQARLFDFNEGSIREPALRGQVFAAAARAGAAGIPVLYAMNLRLASWSAPVETIRAVEREAIGLADIVMLNGEELAYMTGLDGERGLDALLALGPRVGIVTHGGSGDILVSVAGKHASVAPYHVPVMYDVGAGDTFHAGLVAAMRRRAPAEMTLVEWVNAVRFAAATAAIRVSTSADPHDLPTTEQVTAWMAAYLHPTDQGKRC